MNVLVTGGTGKIGTYLVPYLLARNIGVTVLTRSPEKAQALPHGATPVLGDLLDPAVLRKELPKVEGLFLNCYGDLEIFQGLNAVDLAKRCGIKYLVYISGQFPDTLFTPPHCGVKSLTEKVIRESGIPYTILRPNTFMQNDLNAKDAILRAGLYPIPLGKIGVSRVDVRDIAEAAAVAFSSLSHAGKAYTIAGPEVMTGEGSTSVWSRVLGKTIRYIGDDMDGFEAEIAKHMPPYFAHDLRMMYEIWQRDGFVASKNEIDLLATLLDHPPRSYVAFVEETIKEWGETHSALA